MAAKAMWEVDPETRSKLLAIQKESNNSLCCDCNAPSPQWASPKFGIFICLSCAGVHRGLGVHISFVRSISMDAFKAAEIERMRLGGNARWRAFYEGHADTAARGLAWDDATIAERYGGEAGEEWKERLTARVEGREYVPGERKTAKPVSAAAAAASASPAASSPLASRNGSRAGTPALGAAAASALLNGSSRTASPSRKARVDDKYFARLGADNASRPEDLPPSQGGKYAGFGSAPTPARRQDQALPGMDELQKDPVAALGKGLGWFTSAVSKTAKSVHDGYIQPTAKQIAESDLAAQARLTAAQVARSAQVGVRSAQDGFSRFVEGPDGGPGGRRQVPIDESKKDFWDDFSSLADERRAQQQANSSIGTSALGMGKSSAPRPAGLAKPVQKDEWEEW